MDEDQEIQAMSQISKILSDLKDNDAITRVLRWTADRYGVSFLAKTRNVEAGGNSQDGSENDEADGEFSDIASLFSAAGPSTEMDKALVAGYWTQVIEGQEPFESFTINKQLKNLGHGVTNITRALDELMELKPQLVLQTQKSGKSKQARKKYKLTEAGISRVKAMLAHKETDQPGKE